MALSVAAAFPGTPAPVEAQAPPPSFSTPPATLPAMPGTESHDDLGHPFSAASLRAEPPSGSPPAFDPAKLFGSGNAPARAAAPAAVTARPAPSASPPLEFNFGEPVDLTQVTLRALYLTDGDLTPHQVVDCCSQLPGIRSCLVIVSGNVISSGHDSGSEEVQHFTANAPKSHEYLAGLAGSMGIEGDGSFTLRSGTSVRTFFIARGLCLAVLHARSGFAPGVRDKLLLTARCLADLTD